MARKIFFTSFKGGTGVTTVCVGLGLALGGLGERTLVADGDALGACAMVIAGMGNMQSYTLADYERGACRAKQAAVMHPKQPNMHIMPSLGMKSAATAAGAIGEIQGLYDYVLSDKLAPEICDCAVIVTEPYLPSVKSADCCRAALADSGMREIMLIVNKSDGAAVTGGEELSPAQAAEILNIRLLAALPFDRTLPAGRWQKRTVGAFRSAALALTGKSVVPFDVTAGYGGLGGILKRGMRNRV